MRPAVPRADEPSMVGRTTIRDTSELPIFMSRRTRSRRGSYVLAIVLLLVFLFALRLL